MGSTFNKNFAKKRFVGPVKSVQDILTDTFFSRGRDILATVAMGPAEHKRQTQHIERFSSIQTLVS